jgi:phenylalanyl-tRNA synthetase beta chain
MKISFDWLKDFIKTDLSPEKVSEILTDTGLEVEKLERFEMAPGGLNGVVVGHVRKVVPHPDADRLRVTTVDVGADELLTIVCGAPNVAEGQKVLVATVGSVLHPEEGEPLKIKRAKIRGVESAGMICAEDELGIGKSHEGIMVLPAHAPVGKEAAEFLDLSDDWVFEIGLTPNRTDAFGHFGVARDLAARINLSVPTKALLPDLEKLNIDLNAQGRISVDVADSDGCGRYAGLYLDRIKVTPSPAWLQNRLRAIGLSPINNVVDITNYVLHETGQPLHAFDADKISGKKVVVKTLPEGTVFTTLDGVERKLASDDLMICDDQGGMCIAGVFGGAQSGVTEGTTSVFLESAWFNPMRVRKTAKRHGLNTDASFRFERGVDPSGTVYALHRAALLMKSICGAEIKGPLIDIIKADFSPVIVDFSLERCNKLCGTAMHAEELESILASLDFKIKTKDSGTYLLEVPTYRVDVTREIDVIEEVLRIYGYNRVARPDRMQISVSDQSKPSRQEVLDSISGALVGRGFTEMMANGLTRSDYLRAVGGDTLSDHLVAMLNPLSQELDVLRPNLVCSALEAVAYNLNRQAERLQFFEIGTVYRKDEHGYAESTHLSIALTGNRFFENWNNPATPFAISDMKGHVCAVLELLGFVDGITFSPESDPFYGDALVIYKGKKKLGILGIAGKKALKQYGIKKQVLLAELDLNASLKLIKHAAKVLKELPKFPAVRRDFSLLIDQSIGFEEIETAAYRRGRGLLREVGLFDVFEGNSLPEGKKSYAVRFILQDPGKTLTDQQIDKTMLEIQKELEQSLGATLR